MRQHLWICVQFAVAGLMFAALIVIEIVAAFG